MPWYGKRTKENYSFIHNGRTPEERFWDRINKKDKNSCWEWIGTKDTNGYGRIKFYGKTEYTHILSYRINKGVIDDGLVVCHKCDNPPCVNPDHLFLGTQRENILDAKKKNRMHPGEKTHGAKLSSRDVIEIRKLYNEGVLQKEIAKRYGVIQQNISAIVLNKRWRHLNTRVSSAAIGKVVSPISGMLGT